MRRLSCLFVFSMPAWIKRWLPPPGKQCFPYPLPEFSQIGLRRLPAPGRFVLEVALANVESGECLGFCRSKGREEAKEDIRRPRVAIFVRHGSPPILWVAAASSAGPRLAPQV
jgi:hypothetical protein